MASPLRVLITDCDYKHSIALQLYIRRALPEVKLVGYSSERIRFARFFNYCDKYLECVPFSTAVSLTSPDLVIPVGGRSVRTAQALAPTHVVLPSAESLDNAYDKSAAVALARSLGIPSPRTVRIRSPQQTDRSEAGFPCVVKPASEIDGKFVEYPGNRIQLEAAVHRGFARLGTESNGLIVQEYVSGIGAGFSALYDHGRLRRVFMHRRIREWPLSGGPSTAAGAIRDVRLMRAGTAILDALQWNGVAMVEFKFQPESGNYVFIEVNGKFWGSCELALAAGVNFGADLIRMYRGEPLHYDDAYNDLLEFYWPLDGDMLALAARHQLRNVRDYFGPHARTNLRQSLRADALKTLSLMVKLTRLAIGRE